MNSTGPAVQLSETDWHAAESELVLRQIGSGPEGLSDEQAALRLATHGLNVLPEAPRRGLAVRILSQLNHVLIYVLLGAALLSLALAHALDAVAILAVVALNTLIGVVQEGRAERAMDAVRQLLAPESSVLRNGVRRRIPSRMLVPGDVVVLEAGDRVSADLRLISARGLFIDESILTGEAAPVMKIPTAAPLAAPLAERASMAFSGTLVTAGLGRGVVVGVGLNTELGRISGLVRDVRERQSPLVRRMNQFGVTLTTAILSLGVCILLFAVLLRGYPFSQALMAVIGLSVAAIPEGLPAVLTIILAVGAQRMARRNAIVRRIPAIETLGAVTVICSDKTGTMTRNEMTVTAAVQKLANAGEFAMIALLASDATISEHGGERRSVGDPMDVATLEFALREGVDAGSAPRSHARIDLIPFDAAHRFMASLNRWPDGCRRVSVKGAPEQVLAMCVKQADGVHEAPLDLAFWTERINEFASEGARVLAVAVKEVRADCADINLDDVATGCTFLGVLAFEDPPRAEAIEAVSDCHAAGIQVKMITGDHAVTARAIARRLGLKNTEMALTGADLDALDSAEFDRAAREVDVFARVTPKHKLRLVEAMQRAGGCVAMTGDGVNDAPALKQADVGLAMGRRGSDAAKEASDIVLADDNFATIERAIRAGRTVCDNLRKVILFELPTNGGEASVLIAAILLGVTLPITPLQILWVNMVTTVALSLALAFEPPEPRIMQRPPRPPEAPLLSPFLIWRILLVSALFAAGAFGLFWWARERGADIATARTVAVNALVVLQIFYLFSTRYLHGVSLTLRGVAGTNAVLTSVGLVLVLQAAFTYAPPMQIVFDTRPLDALHMVAIFMAGVLLLLIMEADKAAYLLRRHVSLHGSGRKSSRKWR
jgi:calcium-translocating P-type ATPase